MNLAIGTRLGPYEVIAPIGAGGMGEVWKARDTRLDRSVAIKVLPSHLSSDPQLRERFDREARAISSLTHPHICTLYDVGHQDGIDYLVMEYLEGETLADRLTKGPLPLDQVFRYGIEIAEALERAHKAGVVHRDLKPGNVMLTKEGAKLLDFGLAKTATLTGASSPQGQIDVPTEQKPLTAEGTIIGTLQYMAPEQLDGLEADARTDIFAFGAMLYEMATGRRAFEGKSRTSLIAAIVDRDPPPISSLQPLTPAGFDRVVGTCLAKDPDERFQSVHDVRLELGWLKNAQPPQPMRRRSAIHAVLSAVWPLAVAAMAIAIAIIMSLAAGRRKAKGFNDSLQLSVSTSEVAHIFRDEVALPVALSPDGHFLVVYGEDADAVPGLWLHDLRTGAARQLAQNAFSPGWSSDSKAIAFFADGKLKTLAIEGGPARIVCDARAEGTPAWYGDTILFVQYSTEQPGILRVNAAGGKPERIVAPDFGLPWWPQFLPDGNHFLYLTLKRPIGEGGDVEHELRIGSIDGGAPRRVPSAIDSRAVYTNGNLLFVRDGTLLAQPFDPDKAQFTGEARSLVDDLHYFRNTGTAAFTVSGNGVLAWRLARRPSRLLWLDRTGIEVGSVATGLFLPDGRLSPDGHRYALGVVDPKQGVSDLWIYDLDRDSAQRVTFRLLDEKAPVWAADGRAIFYRSDGGGGPPDIFRWTPEAELGKVYFRGPSVEEPQDVSPDGKWLLFVAQREAAGADINLLPLMPPGPPRPFVATPFNELSPRFSPDGRWVAYQSDVSGRPEVYVRPFDGAPLVTRVSKDGGTRPRWRHDGTELFFLGPGGRLMSASMRSGLSTAAPHILFQVADAVNFEPALDGSRFLVQLEERTSDPPVHLLINWPARLSAQN